MIYLIGGSPRSGKTKLAKKLSKDLNIPWISIDSFRPVIKPYLSADVQLPFDEIWKDQSNDELFEKYTAEEIFEAGEKEAQILWEGVKEFIVHNIHTYQDYIIEGEQLFPKLIHTLKDLKNIKIIYLVRMDEEKTLKNIKKKHDDHDWLHQHSKDSETLEKAAHWICQFGVKIKNEADKYGFEVKAIEDNFFEQLDEIVELMKK